MVSDSEPLGTLNHSLNDRYFCFSRKTKKIILDARKCIHGKLWAVSSVFTIIMFTILSCGTQVSRERRESVTPRRQGPRCIATGPRL